LVVWYNDQKEGASIVYQLDFGKAIRALREKYGWTQGQVGEKLGYSTASISRIECGKLDMPFSMVEAVLQLLGYDFQDYILFFLEEEERFGYLTIKKLNQLHAIKNYGEMRRLIEEITGRKPFNEGLFLQYLQFCEVVSDEVSTPQERITRLVDIIRLTRRDFQEETVGSTILTTREVTMIALLADIYHIMGNNEKAVQILYGLKKSLDVSFISDREKARTYPAVLFNLSVCLGNLERNEEMNDICMEARRFAVRNESPRSLPSILGTMAHYRFLQKDFVGMKDLLYQAYFTARGLEQFQLANTIAGVARERYGIDLEAIFTL
jgi:putative transcriptional regulator